MRDRTEEQAAAFAEFARSVDAQIVDNILAQLQADKIVGQLVCPNLRGHSSDDANQIVAMEMMAAGVMLQPVLRGWHNGCDAMVTGRLKGFEFRRFWKYWPIVALRPVPLAVAVKMHEDPDDIGGPYGTRAIRVNGDCTCPAPLSDVDTYHIDTVNGLKLFVETMRGNVLTY